MLDVYCLCGTMLLKDETVCGTCRLKAFIKTVLWVFLRRKNLCIVCAKPMDQQDEEMCWSCEGEWLISKAQTHMLDRGHKT